MAQSISMLWELVAARQNHSTNDVIEMFKWNAIGMNQGYVNQGMNNYIVVNEKSTATEKSREVFCHIFKNSKNFFSKIIARFFKCLIVFKTFFFKLKKLPKLVRTFRTSFGASQNLYGHCP